MSRGFDWIFWLAGGVVGLGGLALLLWSLFADRPRGRRRCPKCWYDLTGSPQMTCSECGHSARRERSLRKIRRRWRWAIAGLLLIVAGYEIGVTPRIRTFWQWSRWRGAIPTTVLLAAQAWLDEPLAQDLDTRVTNRDAWTWQRAWYARILESRYLRARGGGRHLELQKLGILGAAAEGCLPTVFAAARDPYPPVRSSAAYVIGEILREPETSLTLLVDMIADQDAMVRLSAAWALLSFGREIRVNASAAVPALRECLQDESEWVRIYSAFALGWITGDPAPAVSATASALVGTQPDLAMTAALYIGELDPALEGIVLTLCQAAGHSDRRVRLIAVQALARAGRRAADAVPILIQLLNDRELDIHIAAAHTLGEIGPAAAQAVPDLDRLRSDPEPQASQAAAEALEKIRRAP